MPAERYIYRAIDQPGQAIDVFVSHANNRIEADHGRLRARLRPMRGLRQEHGARVVSVGHALVQNVRRRHYELAVEEPVNRRLAVAFDELALATWRPPAVTPPACGTDQAQHGRPRP